MNRFLSTLSLFLLISLLSLPAFAERNLSGVWTGNFFEDQVDRLPGPEMGDFGGIPISPASRMRAVSWSASQLALPHYQCRVHPADYAQAFANIRIWENRDPHTEELLSYTLQHFAWQTRRTIWMDGREHPPEYAKHTSMGFSTGEWNGHVLTVTTTHLKESFMRRNGMPRSDRAVVTEHFIRHGDILNWTVIIDDPVYLEAPLIRNRDMELSATTQVGTYPCESVVEMVRDSGYVPHYLPGQNPVIGVYAQRHNIPFEAAMGGAVTMYPEYMHTIREMQRAGE